MIEIKLTNGDYVRNMDDAHFTLWVFGVANLIINQQVTENDLCAWLGMSATESEGGGRINDGQGT